MNYRTAKFLKQIGILFLVAAVLTIMPRLLVASIMGFINLAITVAVIWILYQLLSPIYRDYRRRRGGRKRPQNWYSDRR